MNFFEMILYFLIGFCLAFLVVCIHIILEGYRRRIYQKSTICPICEKETKGQNPHYFRRDGELYRVHRGTCANEFLYGDLFGEKIKNE